MANELLSTMSGCEKTWGNIKTTFDSDMDKFMSYRVAEILSSGNTLTAEDLRKNIHTIYLIVSPKDKDRLAPFIATFFDTYSSNLLSNREKKESDIGVTFLIDEFTTLGKIDSLRSIPEIGRGYRFNALFIAQSLTQITSKYGQDDMKVFKENCAYTIVLGQSDSGTAKMISQDIGNETVKRKTSSKNGDSETLEGKPLIPEQDLLNMSKEENIILVQDHLSLPIKAKRPYYFKEKKC